LKASSLITLDNHLPIQQRQAPLANVNVKYLPGKHFTLIGYRFLAGFHINISTDFFSADFY
ncbi:MAG: hypothetical protein ACTS2F_18555, partial [Thainema sp.]